MHESPSSLLLVAIQAALAAGELIKRGYGTSFKISSKPGKQNLVTEYDKAAEKLIISSIKKQYPDHGFFAEESGKKQISSSKVLWVIDPLDGTVNFARSIPFFSVSIAASYQNEILCGVVFQPMTQELFVAEKGKGSYLNGTRLHVSKTKKLGSALVATGFPYNVDENPLNCIETFSRLIRLGLPIRRLGSAALDLSYVAAGRFDAFWEVILQPWDIAAGKLILEEAGGKVTHYDGKKHPIFTTDTLLASNGFLHQQMVQLLTDSQKGKRK